MGTTLSSSGTGTTWLDRWWKRRLEKRQQKRVMAAMQSVRLSVVTLNQAMTQAGFTRDKRRQVWRELLKTQGALLPWFVGHDAKEA